MNATNLTNDLIEALLGDEDEDEEVGLGKEMAGPPDELLNRQLTDLLPKIVRSKEEYLGKPCVRTVEHTNPQGETFIFGKFGHRKGVMSTLLYLHHEQGWIPADTSGALGEDLEDEDEEDFKDVYNLDSPTKKYLPLGSLSSGTMREEDLIPRFLHVLKWIDPEKGAQLEAEYKIVSEEPEDISDFCWQTLYEALNEYAPPYAYFGAHPGDGADYGVWVSDEAISDDLEYENTDELVAQKAGDPFIPGSNYVVVIDDSGLYTALLNGHTGQTIWSVE